MKGMTKQLLDDVADKEPVITNKRRREENKDRLLVRSPKEECVSFTPSSIQIMIRWVIGSDLYHPTAAGSPVTAVKQVLRVGTQRLLTNKPSRRVVVVLLIPSTLYPSHTHIPVDYLTTWALQRPLIHYLTHRLYDETLATSATK